MTIGDPSLLAGWSAFRVEAWRGITHGDVDFGPGWTLDPGAVAPFAIAPAILQPGPGSFSGLGTAEWPVPESSVAIRGVIAVDSTPGVSLAWVAITGVGADGRRYILEGPDFLSTAFNGTVADWLTAVLSGR